MGLFDLLNSGKVMHKKAKLLVDIDLDNGESRKKGDIVYVVLQLPHNQYHIEDNEFACTASADEIKIL
jgi:hypothetical protein